MNHYPRRPRSTFTPTEAVVLSIAGVLILSLSAFVLISALQLLNQPASAAPQPAAVLPAATATRMSTPAATSLPPSPTLYLTRTTTPPPTPVPPPAACVPQNTEIRLGTVNAVLDGDTLLVDSGGELILVGYAGIDAPGLAAGRLGDLALQQNRALLAGQEVVLVKDDSESDPDGRLLRYVLFASGSRFANYELVRQGLAAVLDSPDQACAVVLRAAEQAARTEKLGLWLPTAVPTATFLPTVVLNPGLQAPCDCSVRYVCSSFSSQNAAQACFNACNDYNSKLDEDHDGLACEELP
jgi:micrococcal nuclease